MHHVTLHVLLDKIDALEVEAGNQKERLNEAHHLIMRLILKGKNYEARIKRIEGRRSLSVKVPNERVRP